MLWQPLATLFLSIKSLYSRLLLNEIRQYDKMYIYKYIPIVFKCLHIIYKGTFVLQTKRGVLRQCGFLKTAAVTPRIRRRRRQKWYTFSPCSIQFVVNKLFLNYTIRGAQARRVKTTKNQTKTRARQNLVIRVHQKMRHPNVTLWVTSWAFKTRSRHAGRSNFYSHCFTEVGDSDDSGCKSLVTSGGLVAAGLPRANGPRK